MKAAQPKGPVGRPIRRVEDPRLIQGLASYVDDLRLPGMLHLIVVRSPHAHARITGIRTEAAKAAAGVAGVFTGADLNSKVGLVPSGSLPGQKVVKHTVLASDRVYFVGHPVAVLVATSLYAARDALDLVEVDYDPLPAVTNPEKALEEGSPLAHPDLGTNAAYQWSLAKGDMDKAFAEADRVVRQRIVHQRVTAMMMEPRGCLAAFQQGDDSLTLWTSTQIPHLIRMILPPLIGLPEHKVRIVAPEVGGGFGAKLNLYSEEIICSHLARQLGAPVKWIESRRENAAVTTQGRDQIGDYEVAVKKDGTLLAIRYKAIADLGAYMQMGTPAIPTFTALMMSACYKVRAIRADITGVLTNKMATDAYRGAGRPEATFAIERLLDLVAVELGLDPVQVRVKNFIKPGEFPYQTLSGLTYDSGNYAGALRKAQELADWDRLLRERGEARAAGKLFGIGLSTYMEICAFGPSKMMGTGGWEWGCVRMEMSGKVTVITGASPHGQGQETSFAQIVADRLGVPMGDVVVLRGDTAVAPYGRDTYGSRATVLGGSALVMCVDKIMAKATRLAAHMLKVAPKNVLVRDGRFSVRGKPKQSLGWNEVAKEAYVAINIPRNFEPGLEASSFFEPPNCAYPFGTHIAAVEVDRDTGEVKIVKFVAVDDCGPQINPLLVAGQVHGGIAQSLGQALFEQTVYDENGQLLTGEFTDYAMPRARDIPEYILGHTVTPTPDNPLGVKGVGEAGTIGSLPAIANAVMDALAPLGVRHVDMPLLPEKLWNAIQEHSPRKGRKRGPAAGKGEGK